jgi:DNA (cytosine-5)-methyltransferase 1
MTGKRLDLDRRQILVTDGAKGSKSRIVPMIGRVSTSAAELLTLEGIGPDEFLWSPAPAAVCVATARSRARISIRGGVSVHEAAASAAAKPHTTRHTFATRMRELGLEMEEIQLLLGHESIRTTSDTAQCSTIDNRSLLVVEPLRYALALRPRWIALEQVPPVLAVWQLFAEILRGHGYRAWCGILSAEQYGVPQTRQRAFLLADRDAQPMPPLATHQPYEYGVPAAERHTLEGTLLPWISMADALGWGMTERPSVTVTAQANRGAGAAPLDGGSGARETLRRERREGRWYDRRQGNTLADGSRQMVRLVPDSEPAPTISAGTGDRDRWVFNRPATTIAGDRRVFQPGGHHEPGKQSENAIPITIEEASILQGFRPDYPWQGETNKARFQQVGNAVPPPLAQAVITSLLGSELARRAEGVAA